MKISKTLFKNLMRCPNFVSLLDMHRNRGAHNIKTIEGHPVEKIIEIVSGLEYAEFNEMDDNVLDIFSCMFDSESGNDLLNTTSAQLEAFAETFIEVERLAIKQASKVFNHDIYASTNTYEQKQFAYQDGENTFSCYLDGYMEDENDGKIRIFEVKATTSRNFDECYYTIRKTKTSDGAKLPLFLLDNQGIIKYIGDEYFNQDQIDHKKLIEKKACLLNPYDKIGKYIYDLAIERHIIENSLIQNQHDDLLDKIEYYLIVLNSEYVFDGTYINGVPDYHLDGGGHELFKIYDMNILTAQLQPEILEKRNKINYYLNNMAIKSNCLGTHCEYKKTTECKYTKVCMRKALIDGSLLEFIRKNHAFFGNTIGPKGKREKLTMYDLLNEGIYMIDECRPYLEKPINLMQYDCYVNNRVYINRDLIERAINQVNYPLYHLDFESYNCPLPRFKGENPYMQSLFQYSLHIEREPGKCELVDSHFEYLAPDHLDHREDLIKQLISNIDLSKGGHVLVYNQSFEKTRLNELARMFPKYKKELDEINNHIFDLLNILNGGESFLKTFLNEEDLERFLINHPGFNYYNNDLHGSFSIKKVLPIFTDLSYKELEVRNGTEAILAYGQLNNITDTEYQNKYQALRIYCRQDTWAMVEILWGLKKLIKEKTLVEK